MRERESERETKRETHRETVFSKASAFRAGQTVIDGQLWLFKMCDLNLTINHMPHGLYLQHSTIVTRICSWKWGAEGLREESWVYYCLSLPYLWPSLQICSIQPVWYFPTMPSSCSTWHLHSPSGWENSEWLQLLGLLKHSILGHNCRKHLHYFS